MDFIFNENQPIYYQILTHIYFRILRGEFQRGEKLPSVIEASMLYKVNHNTMARAYSELVRAGIAEIKRGEGTYVTEDQTILDKLHEDIRQSSVSDFLETMRSLGYSPEEILTTIIASLKGIE
jgi:GntR family transcriptional regulator